MGKEELSFDEGCVAGDNPWHIRFDVKGSGLGGQPCRHCRNEQIVYHKRSLYPGEWEERVWVCPRVINITPDDPYHAAQVCLDCVLEAVEANKL